MDAVRPSLSAAFGIVGGVVNGPGAFWPAGPDPTFGVYLLGEPPPPVGWESRWLRWPDFRLPSDRDEARVLLREAWERAASERVEVDSLALV